MKTVRIGIVCGLGALVGTLTALQFSWYFAWIGFLTGGLVGYMVIDLPGVMAASSAAFKAVMEEIFPAAKAKFQLFLSRLKVLAPGFAIVGLLFSILACSAPIANYSYQGNGTPLISLFGLAISAAILSGVIGCLGLFLLGLILTDMSAADIHQLQREFSYIPLKKWVLFINPVTGFLAVPLLPLAAVAGVAYLLVATVSWRKIVMATGHFLKLAFIQIHSELRFLCFVHASLGSIVGFFAGHLLIGMAAGAFFGMINYEIVTKRWLKLVPRTN